MIHMHVLAIAVINSSFKLKTKARYPPLTEWNTVGHIFTYFYAYESQTELLLTTLGKV